MIADGQNAQLRNQWTGWLKRTLRPTLVGIPLLGLLGGFTAQLAGYGSAAGWVWGAATLPVLLALLVQIVVSMWRGEFGLDIVATLSMAGALVFGEYLAAVVVALMYAGGQYLESFAEGRARREMTKLLSRVPRTALRHWDGVLEEVGLGVLEPGDRIMLRRGEVVAVDGTVAKGVAVLGQSALTWESLPIQQHTGEAVLSGSTNAGDTFDLVVSARRGEHLCWDREAGRGRSAIQGADVAPRRPFSDGLPRRHRGDRGRVSISVG